MNKGHAFRHDKRDETKDVTVGQFTLVYCEKKRKWILPGSAPGALKSCGTKREAQKWAQYYAKFCGRTIETTP